jgi:hypothetical protein
MLRNKIKEKQSRAKRIKILLKAYEKKFTGEYLKMANFQEPIVMLMRNTRKIEFFDNATTGWFQYNHTDATTRKVKLSPEFLQTFDYGKRTFKGYILHEDHPTPLPESPVVTAEQFQWAIDKTQQDLVNHKAKELGARGDMWYKILIGIAVIIGVFGLIKLLVPDFLVFDKAAELISLTFANRKLYK